MVLLKGNSHVLCIFKSSVPTILHLSAQPVHSSHCPCLGPGMPSALVSPAVVRYSASLLASVLGEASSWKLTEHFLIEMMFQAVVGRGHRA